MARRLAKTSNKWNSGRSGTEINSDLSNGGEVVAERCSTCEATFASRLTGSKSHWTDTSTFSCPTGKNLMIDGEKMVILYGYMLFGLKNTFLQYRYADRVI
jgi:hypothetical protein